MIVSFEGKNYRLSVFPPLVGRELMVKGSGCKNILQKDLTAWLPILSHVEVNTADSHWIKLTTRAMVENHVKDEYVADLLLLQLQHNCYNIEALINGPTIGEVVWAELTDIVEQVFDHAT